jgi:hypothetical protein
MYGVIIIYLMLLGCGIEVLSRSSQTGVVEVKGVDEIMRDESGKKCGARLAHQSVRNEAGPRTGRSSTLFYNNLNQLQC